MGRQRRIILGVFLCVAGGLASPAVHAQSFDCKKAATVIEKAICSDHDVSYLDQLVAKDFKQLLKHHPEERSSLLLSGRRWLQGRNASCQIFARNQSRMTLCLRAQYQARVAVLESPNPLAPSLAEAVQPARIANSSPNAGAVAPLYQTACSSGMPKVDTPADLRPFVPSGSVAVEWHLVDLNDDGRPDYFLVVERLCDDRTILLIVRGQDGSLSLAASNSDVIVSRSSSGEYSGYEGASVGPGTFTIAQESGSAAGGMSETVTFGWSRDEHTWVVRKYDFKECDPSGCPGQEHSTTGPSFQKYTSQLQTKGG